MASDGCASLFTRSGHDIDDAIGQADFLGQAVWLWLAFIGIVALLLAFDLGVLHRDDHEIGVGESLWLSAGYIAVAALFGASITSTAPLGS